MGINNGSISNCYVTGIIKGNGATYIGGLVGKNGGSISGCYTTGIVTGGDYSYYIGGLVGYCYNNISNCYSTSNVVGGYDVWTIGGLVGRNFSPINNCYSAGKVTSGDLSGDVGGLVGWNTSQNISNCYFLITSGSNNGCGTPLTIEQMRQQSNFVGWDFNNVWHICETYNYPKLIWQMLPGDIVCPDGVDFLDIEALCKQWLLEEIPADLAPSGGDGIVNFADFAVFAAQWSVTNDINDLLDFAGQWLKEGIPYCSADIAPLPDGDGIVNFADFALIAKEWPSCFVSKATSPEPADYTINVSKNVILQWSPGESCMSHHVFFGTDFNEVNDADITNTNVYMGNQVTNSWDANGYNSNGLDFNTTYYWRIDEAAAGCIAKGDIWSFITQASDYNPNFVSWWKFDEGSGTTVYDSIGNNNGIVYGATWTSR